MVVGCAGTCDGLERVLAAELEDLGASPRREPEPGTGWLTFEVDGVDGIVDVLLGSRIAHRVGGLVAEEEVDRSDPFEVLGPMAQGVDWRPWVPSDGSWALRVTRQGEHAYDSQMIEHRLGAILHGTLQAQLGSRPPVDLEAPATMIRLRLDAKGRARLWVDLVGPRSLHRRGYRAHQHRAALKASIACGLIRMTGWDESSLLVDPMAGGGTFGIEAVWQASRVSPTVLRADALLGRSTPALGLEGHPRSERREPASLLADASNELVVLGDRNPRHVEGSQRNLDAAGVARAVRVYEGEVGTLSSQVEQAGAIVSNPPYGIRSSHPRELEPTYDRLFEQAAQVLAGQGRIGLVTPLVDLVERAGRAHGFEVVDRCTVQHGKLVVGLVVLAG